MDLTTLIEPLVKRPRRNRKSEAIRRLVEETHLSAQNLIAPLFIVEGENQKQPIRSLPGIYRLSIDNLVKEVIHLYELGIFAVDLFPLSLRKKKIHSLKRL